MADDPIAILSYGMFEPHVGTRFMIADHEGASVALTLVECTARPERRLKWMKRVPFSLLFTADHGTRIPCAVFSLSHDSMGAIGDLLITQVINDDDPTVPTFEIGFN